MIRHVGYLDKRLFQDHSESPPHPFKMHFVNVALKIVKTVNNCFDDTQTKFSSLQYTESFCVQSHKQPNAVV